MTAELVHRPRKVVVVGGSLSGLMCAIALKHSGCDVTVLEKEDDNRESHMAGVGLGRDIMSFLARHDRVSSAFTIRIVQMQAVKTDSNAVVFVRGRRYITSWDAYYFRLRSIFDGLKSPYYPSPPEISATDGIAHFESHREVVDIYRKGGEDDIGLTLKLLNSKTQQTEVVQADFVIGADGPSSFIRSKYLPRRNRRTVGYVTWRGVVAERDVSEATRTLLQHSSNIHMVAHQHCIAYLIPGENGSLEPGERQFNFAWYTNETPDSLDELLVDAIDEHRHRYTVPGGHIREHIWKAKVEDAHNVPFPEPFLEIVRKIKKPFVQVITETDAVRGAFEDGKVLLVGDALCQFRPHTALSATQAAFDSLMVEKYIDGSMSLTEWEEKVLRFARLHSYQSRYWGITYQQGPAFALVAACKYWWLWGVDQVRAWWNGEEPLLIRTDKFYNLNDDED